METIEMTASELLEYMRQRNDDFIIKIELEDKKLSGGDRDVKQD